MATGCRLLPGRRRPGAVAYGEFTAQQVGAGIGDREGPLDPFHEPLVDVVEPRPLVALEQSGRAGRADAALYRLDGW
ncbi:hypothetical protein [Streptomyces botrytidirepellens]|uniref:hypothetical protein n=1 Tax=Streptomyces botrytidirepellens TaxID=2486417 RepID=UPI00161E1191|nr:hypothetical protein [Streptomyces botrytidirepellens]